MYYIPLRKTHILKDLGNVYIDNGDSTLRISETDYESICQNNVESKRLKSILHNYYICSENAVQYASLPRVIE